MEHEKTRYSDDELQEFRELIEEKLEVAKKQLASFLEQITISGESSDSKVKGLDDAVSGVERERMTRLASRQKKHIQHLENALLRIQNKVYGICRDTGKLISKERLRAVPHATLSIAAKEKR